MVLGEDQFQPLVLLRKNKRLTFFASFSALIKTVDAQGKSVFSGRHFTGFSNEEEELFGTVKVSQLLIYSIVD
jgi:hypothetical protein